MALVTLMAISSVASSNILMGYTYAQNKMTNPTVSRVIDPILGSIPNGDFEDTEISGVGAGSYPSGGWTGGAKNTSDDTPTFSTDAYLHSWSWQQSLNGTTNSWKWIGYDFWGAVPDFVAFALKEVSGSDGNNLVSVLIEDHGQNPVVRMCYEFSTSPSQVRLDGWDGYAYSYTYHEQIDVNTWYYRIKNWKTDWLNKLGDKPAMHDYWRVVFSVDSYGVGSPMAARYDAIWMGNSIPNLVPNGDFEDTRIYNIGENASPSYWSSWIRNPGEGGSVSFSQNSYSGSWSCEVTTVPVLHAFKGIYQDIGANPPDNISFAIYGVALPTDNNLINVRIVDITEGKELSYEFSTSSGQIHREWNTYQVARHEQIQAGEWYYRSWSTWKTDWNIKYAPGPDMSHNWRVLLLVENYFTSFNMTARYDAISIGPTGGDLAGSSFLPLLMLSVLSTALILTALVIARSQGLFSPRNRTSRSEESAQISPSEEEKGGEVGSKKGRTRSMGKCMVCNIAVYDSADAIWCPFCGSLAHKAHLLEWLHVRDTCPVCKNHLHAGDLE